MYFKLGQNGEMWGGTYEGLKKILQNVKFEVNLRFNFIDCFSLVYVIMDHVTATTINSNISFSD